MRYSTLILALTSAALLTGCSSLISLNPFVPDGQAASDPRLVGTWKGAAADSKEQFSIVQKGAIYGVHYWEDGSSSANFEARLARIGNAEVLDLICTDDKAFAIPVHMLARVWPGDDTLRWVLLDSDWLRQQARQSLATQETDDRTLVTTQGETAAQFLTKFGADERAYGQISDLVKVK